jgi:hypothetical protein
MPVSKTSTSPDGAQLKGSELTPLVSDEAREFLDGTISAEDYSEFVSRHAAREAGYDTVLRRQLQQTSKLSVQVRLAAVSAVLAVAAYATVGIALPNKQSGLTLIVAAVSGVTTGLFVTVLYNQIRRRK